MAKTIMTIDDSPSVRHLLNLVLKGAGFEVVQAADGREALGLFTGQKVHLIICDVNMPNMDGITFVKRLKQLPEYKFTPVIMLTTESQEEIKREAKAAGAKAWVIKPFKPEQLLNAVERLVMP